MHQLAEAIRAVLSHYDAMIENVDIRFGSPRQVDVPHTFASMERIKESLGFEPNFYLKQGLTNACKWYWDNLDQRLLC